jgi:DNA-binding MarR family transcriptional regulator
MTTVSELERPDARTSRAPGKEATVAVRVPASPRPNEVASRLRMAVMRLARRLRQESEPGLTPSMLAVLASIHGSQPVTLGALAAIERVQPPTITATVARLEEAGLVGRETDAQDRRVVRVHLTEEGHRLIRRNRSRRDAFLAVRLRGLPAEDVAALDRAASIVERILEESP